MRARRSARQLRPRRSFPEPVRSGSLAVPPLRAINSLVHEAFEHIARAVANRQNVRVPSLNDTNTWFRGDCQWVTIGKSKGSGVQVMRL